MKNKTIKILVALLMLSLSLIGFKFISNINLIPSKYLNLFLIVILIFNILGVLLILTKGIITKVFCSIIYVILGIISIFCIVISLKADKYLNNFFNNIKEITVYNVITLKTNDYDKIEDLEGKTIGYLSANIDNNKYLENIRENINSTLKEYNILELYSELFNNEVEAIVVNEAYLDLLEEQYPGFEEQIKVIYTFNIEELVEKNNEKIKNLKSINIYISGSDSRNEYISANSLSDVNMIMTINPNTHTILLTNTPRDFYVQLHGTTGMKDKLTHAGMYGVDMSRQTIEDLYGIKIDYSIKVGFRGVIEVVDLIGGVDIYSDTAFYSRSGDGGAKRVNVKVGMNHFNGAQALSYARERYSYSDGDQHRGRNQQQIIEAVFSKVLSDKSILLRADELIETFSKLYITDIPKDVITLLIKEQLDKMPSWKFETQEVGGTQSKNQTYSMPGIVLYVTEPDNQTIKAAVSKINKVYSETKK